MIVHLDGEHETVDYIDDRSVLVYDNVENEEYPLHWHDALEIIMPLANSFTAVCEGKEYAMAERDILLIPAGTLHTLQAQPGERLIMLFDNRIIRDNPALSEIYTAINSPVHITAEQNDLLEPVGELIKDIYTIYSDFKELSEAHIYIKLLSALILIAQHRLRQISISSDTAYGEKFRSVLRYIDQNYYNDIDLDELASLAGYSRFYFSRIFKKYCGTTFIAFLNQRRVKAAEIFLLQKDMSVTEIAMRVGFSSLTTFNRVFKEIKGCTPTDFRSLYRRHPGSQL